MTIKTEAPQHSDALISAAEATLQHHGLRLKPGQSVADVVNAISAAGFTLTEKNGYLQATQTTAGQPLPAHVHEIFEGVATKQPDRFFPRSMTGVTSRDSLDREGKMQFIKEHGLAAWEQLPQSAPTETTVVLDKSRLTREQWLSLDLATRAQLSAQFGPDAIGQIMARRSAKR